MSDAPGRLVEEFTIDLNEGDMTGLVHVARGRTGWGVNRLEVATRTPVRPEFLPAFLEAWATMLRTGGLDSLVEAHDTEDRDA